MNEKTNSKNVWPTVIIIIILLALGWWFLGAKLGSTVFTSSNNSSYQAVFLTNDQVYFGHLSHNDSQFPTLTDIFYLQVAQPLQPIPSSQAAPNINLVKLGNELHGPADVMRINRDQILFVEDLKSDSQISAAIKKYWDDKLKK